VLTLSPNLLAHISEEVFLLKRYSFLALVVVMLSITLSAQAATKLVVYTYDSFVSWGPAKQIETGFEKQNDVDVVFMAPSSTGEMLSRLITEMETGGTSADVFVGLSDTQLNKAKSRNIFRPADKSKIPNLASVPADLQFDASSSVLPFDHGYVTLVYNTKAIKAADVPKTFEDLTNPKWAKKIIAIDPRTSSVGHAFLMWTIDRYGDKGFANYWKRLSPNLLTVTGSWGAAYKMFENGDAPIVISYATDTAYAVA
jgi:thiamine transport system substrate-binding protein